MQDLQHFATSVFSMLESYSPLLPWLLLSLAPLGIIYAIRKLAPEVWLWLESFGPKDNTAAKLFLALPSAIIGAAVAAISHGGDAKALVLGAAVGLFAPLYHHVLKLMPVPYQGALGALMDRDDDDESGPPGVASLYPAKTMLVCLALSGCTPATAAEVARNTCHGEAHAESHRIGLELCPVDADVLDACESGSDVECQEADNSWDTCEHSDGIEAELELALEECDK